MQKLSRSKLELFTECPRCFWLDRKQGIKRPPPAPYTINNAVDYLLKQEFDVHRGKGTRHPIMEKHSIDAVPFQHDDMNKWRHNFTGVQFHHQATDFTITGAVDDVWINPNKELIVVDYKATGANQHQIYDSYRRQMEIYQWLLRSNGFQVSDTGYFVFARVSKAGGFALPAADSGEGEIMGRLSFNLFVEPIKGDDSWIEDTIQRAKKTFDLEKAPEASPTCGYCAYRAAATGALAS